MILSAIQIVYVFYSMVSFVILNSPITDSPDVVIMIVSNVFTLNSLAILFSFAFMLFSKNIKNNQKIIAFCSGAYIVFSILGFVISDVSSGVHISPLINIIILALNSLGFVLFGYLEINSTNKHLPMNIKVIPLIVILLMHTLGSVVYIQAMRGLVHIPELDVSLSIVRNIIFRFGSILLIASLLFDKKLKEKEVVKESIEEDPYRIDFE